MFPNNRFEQPKGYSKVPSTDASIRYAAGSAAILAAVTRFFAAALAIEMLMALLVVPLPRGYAAGGGYEYVLLIGAACLVIAVRGGGPYSVDRAIGKEL